ncbi:MAG: tetratricopeptide repeat protein [Deltaproteobacteria bacterium]|nr:tetratricopeptide repeat protein [Deltaproteobacteria bacterium]MBI3387826.1 tetratricopeptide repeat protein [Deltaproteobacteria bacterium]
MTLLVIGMSLPLVAPVSANQRSQALYAKGLVPFHNGKWDDAYQLFDEAVKADPSDALALYYRGLTAARRGQPTVAIPDMEQAAKLRPRLAHLALDLGITYFDAGQFAQAKTWLDQAYATADDRLRAAFFLGMTCYRLREFDKASAYFAEAEKDPELRANAHYYAGLVALQQGQTAEGRKQMEQAAQGRAESETAKSAQQFLSGGSVRQPPAPGQPAARPWSVYGDMRLEYDSNVNLGPNNSPVSGSNTGKSDGDVALGFGGAYNLLDIDVARITASYDFYQSLFFTDSDFNLEAHQLRLQGTVPAGPVQLGLAGAYGYYLLGGDTFYQEGVVTPWVTIPEGESLSTQIYYAFRARNFILNTYNPSRDATNDAVGIRQYALLGAEDRILSVGYQFDKELVEAAFLADDVTGVRHRNSFQYNGNQFDVSVELPLADVATARFAYLLRLEDYQFPDQFAVPAYAFRRHDVENQIFASVFRDMTDYLQLGLTYIGTFNQSNISDPYQYNRNVVSVGARLHY